jgi:outer membrane protein TolC
VKPKLFAFSSLGYGDPGLNMFKSGWQPIGIVGVGLSWNVVDWGKANRDKQSIVIQKMVVDTKKADFVRGITVSMENQKAEIEKLRSQLENDTKLVTLRKRITNVSAKQMNEGTATVFAYLSQLTKEKDAIVLRELHQAQLQKAIADYLYMRGN